jgi:hypothetical protein
VHLSMPSSANSYLPLLFFFLLCVNKQTNKYTLFLAWPVLLLENSFIATSQQTYRKINECRGWKEIIDREQSESREIFYKPSTYHQPQRRRSRRFVDNG